MLGYTGKTRKSSQHIRGRITIDGNSIQGTRKLLILKGEMSEWLKEHAWKAKLARDTEGYAETSTRTPSTN